MCCSQIIEAPTAFDEAEASASDNAVSALGKLCRRSEAIAAGALPRWLAKLPLQADREEARAVHKTLVDMCEATNPHLLGANHERLAEIIIVFGQILNTDLVEEETSTRIANLLKQVKGGLPHILQQVPQHPNFARLNADNKAELERALS